MRSPAEPIFDLQRVVSKRMLCVRIVKGGILYSRMPPLTVLFWLTHYIGKERVSKKQDERNYQGIYCKGFYHGQADDEGCYYFPG